MFLKDGEEADKTGKREEDAINRKERSKNGKGLCNILWGFFFFLFGFEFI